ncbi:MAG: ABC transporter substrate-binding protein [Gemmatimonadaceae bacterium]
MPSCRGQWPTTFSRRARRTVTAGTIVLLACGKGNDEASVATHVPRKKITIAVQPFLSQAPVLFAYADSFFAQEGLDVEFVPVASSTEAIPSLLNGDLDVMPASASPGLFNAMARGIAVRMVADRGYLDPNGCTSIAIGVPPGRAAAMQANPRLVKRISIERQFGILYMIEKSLESVGLTIDSLDTKFIPPLPEAEALAKGTLDAAFLSEPWIARDVSAGKAEIWLRAEKVLPNMQQGFIFFGPSLLTDDPDKGRRFLVAYRRGVAKLMEGKTPENVALLVKETGDTPELVRQSCWPTLRVDGHIDMASTQEFQRWLQQKGLVTTPATWTQMWDPSFLEYADSVLRRRGSEGRL